MAPIHRHALEASDPAFRHQIEHVADLRLIRRDGQEAARRRKDWLVAVVCSSDLAGGDVADLHEPLEHRCPERTRFFGLISCSVFVSANWLLATSCGGPGKTSIVRLPECRNTLAATVGLNDGPL